MLTTGITYTVLMADGFRGLNLSQVFGHITETATVHGPRGLKSRPPIHRRFDNPTQTNHKGPVGTWWPLKQGHAGLP